MRRSAPLVMLACVAAAATLIWVDGLLPWLLATELGVLALVLDAGPLAPPSRLRLHAALSLCTVAALGSLMAVSPFGVITGTSASLASAALLLALGLRFAGLVVPPRMTPLPALSPALAAPLAALSLAALQHTLGGAPLPGPGPALALPLALGAALAPGWTLPTRAAALWLARALALPGAPPALAELTVFVAAALAHGRARGPAKLALGVGLMGFFPGAAFELTWRPLLSSSGVLWVPALALLQLSPLAHQARDEADSAPWGWALVAALLLLSAASG